VGYQTLSVDYFSPISRLYTSIGFKVIRQNEEEGEINWAKLSFGNSEVTFDSGGKASTDDRREVDLYIMTDDVDDLYRRPKDRFKSW
jgi:hypothetical protein